MRWRIPLVTALSLLVLAGCDQGPTAVEAPESDSPTFGVVDNFWLPFSLSLTNCLEEVDAEVYAKWLETSTVSASGNVNYQWKFNVHGWGVGRDTGWEYRWNNAFDWVPHQHDNQGAYTESVVDNWLVIGKGQAPNWKAKVTYQFTVNANGDLTVDFVKAEETCK